MNRTRITALFATVAIFAPVFAAIAANPPKSGSACKKAGISQVYKGKKYTCIKSGRKLVWNKGVVVAKKQLSPSPSASPTQSPVTTPTPTSTAIPTPSPTPSPTASPSPTLEVKINEAYTDHGFARAGETVTDHLSLSTNLEISEIRPLVIGPKGEIALSGTGQLIQGSTLTGKWRITFVLPKNLSPGKYIRKYEVLTSSGLTKNALDFPLEILTPRFWIKTSCSKQSADCPQVSGNSIFNDISTCKIEDATKDTYYGSALNFSRNGFPRISKAWKQTNGPKVLVVPVEYKDIPFQDTLRQALDREYEKASIFYRDNSYGKLNLSFETAPRENWISIDSTWPEWSKKYNDDLVSITRATISLVRNLDLTKYDSIFFGTNKTSAIYWGGGTQEVYMTPAGGVENVYFTVGGMSLGLEHNLGHTLFQLEDLYIHPWNTEALSARSKTVIKYDIMATLASPDFIGWNRWLNGWIEDKDIICLSPNLVTGTVRLEYLSSSQGKRLAVIPQSRGIGIFVEYREAMNNEGKGVYVYRLNSNVGHGSGPLEGIDNLLSDGENVTYYGYRFTIIGADEEAVFIRIDRT